MSANIAIPLSVIQLPIDTTYKVELKRNNADKAELRIDQPSVRACGTSRVQALL